MVQVDPRDMLNNFCFHVYGQKSLFIGENGNGFFLTKLFIFLDHSTLSSDITVHRAGSQLKIKSSHEIVYNDLDELYFDVVDKPESERNWTYGSLTDCQIPPDWEMAWEVAAKGDGTKVMVAVYKSPNGEVYRRGPQGYSKEILQEFQYQNFVY